MTIFDEACINIFTNGLLTPGGEMSIDNITIESIEKITHKKRDNILIILYALRNAIDKCDSKNGLQIYRKLLNLYDLYGEID